jgi:hypothetical protein
MDGFKLCRVFFYTERTLVAWNESVATVSPITVKKHYLLCYPICKFILSHTKKRTMVFICVSCEVTDVESNFFVEAHPCGHMMCMVCFHLLESTTPYLVCPREDCGQRVLSSSLLRVEYTNSFVRSVQRTAPEQHWQPHELLDPLRIWRDTATVGRGVIAVGYKTSANRGPIYNLPFDLENGISEEHRETTVKLFARILHPLLFKDDISDKEAGLPDPDQCEMASFLGLAFKDESLAFLCLYALSTGKVMSRAEIERIGNDNDPMHQSLCRAIFVAKELLMYPDGKKRKVSRWQKFFVEIVYSHVGVGARKMIDVLSKFRVSASTSYLDRSNDKKTLAAVINNPLLQNPLTKYGFIVFSYDNLDFIIKGAKPGNDAWVILTMHLVTAEELRNLGFYSNDPTRRISRQRRTLEELTRDGDGNLPPDAEDTIASVRDKEWEQFSFCILQHIATMIKLRLPNIEDAWLMTDDDGVDWSDYDDIPSHLGINLSLPEKPNVEDGKRQPRFPEACGPLDNVEPFEAVADDDEEIGIVETLISRNNVVVDIPYQDNLNKHSVVQQYMTTVLATIETIQNLNENQDGEYGGEAPVQTMMTPLCGDGSPGAAGLKILDIAASKNRANDFAGLRPFTGGFHWTIELPDKRARLALDVVKFFVSQYRPTETQQKHVLFPRDPRQALEEAPYYLAGHYRAAVDEFSSIHTKTSFSSADVNAHMIQRAKEYALGTEVLQDLRRMELLVLFRDIEKTSSADLLIATLRIVLGYLMVSNARNYIRITVDMLVWWETASEAEKILFEQCILTRRTAEGKPVFVDRLQEMFNTVFRFKCGKVWHPGLAHNVLKTALNLGEIQDQKKAATGFRDQKERQRTESESTKQRLRQVYLHVYVTTRQMNLWGQGPIRIGEEGDERDAMPDCLEVPGAKTGKSWCDASGLRAYPTGLHRAKRYIRTFCLLYPNHPERPVKGDLGVPIQFLGLSREKLAQQQMATEMLRTSVKPTELIKAVKKLDGSQKAWLRSEIEQIKASIRLTRAQTDRINAVDDNLASLARLLAMLQKVYFKKEEGRHAEILEEMATEGCDISRITAEERETIVNGNTIFTLSATMVDQFGDDIQLSI